MTRNYTDLMRYDTMEDRFKYLSLRAGVGVATFGAERYLNQRFYTSAEWRRLRHHIIVRDDACDLAVPGHEIHDKIFIHHMNPMTVSDIVHSNDDNLDPEFLIAVSHSTHNAIHYGDESLLPKGPVERTPGDTILWRRS